MKIAESVDTTKPLNEDCKNSLEDLAELKFCRATSASQEDVSSMPPNCKMRRQHGVNNTPTTPTATSASASTSRFVSMKSANTSDFTKPSPIDELRKSLSREAELLNTKRSNTPAQRREQSLEPNEDEDRSYKITPTLQKSTPDDELNKSAASSHDMPLSMRIIRPLYNLCRQCGYPHPPQFEPFNFQNSVTTSLNTQIAQSTSHDSRNDGIKLTNTGTDTDTGTDTTNNLPPLTHPIPTPETIHTILQQYITATKFYGCHSINPGILTAIRFSLPTLRATSSFHDSDMLALSEILFQHANTALRHIRRLDFSVAGLRGKILGSKGLRSHGALTLSKVLEVTEYVEEVNVQRNTIGPYGATALFRACRGNGAVKVLRMRKCRVYERGALAMVEEVRRGGGVGGLEFVDLSLNRIGFRGTMAFEEMLAEMDKKCGDGKMRVNIELQGNLVFQEIMNGVTHGLGIILSIIGSMALSNRVRDGPLNSIISCGLYSFSLLTLYTSSTLYHSFFALSLTHYVFGVLDHCAIYILIAGSYTPFLRIGLIHNPIASFYLLSFLWICAILGLTVEAFYNKWVHKPKFSLAMYLGMGWSSMACAPEMIKVMPLGALKMLVLGGLFYTGGVPFFVRNNNLDHMIWHIFVLGGSVSHWFCIYWYVAPMNLDLDNGVMQSSSINLVCSTSDGS